MIRLTRLADYAVLLMTHMGHEWDRDRSKLHNANSLSTDTHIPAPTVAKILGVMSRGHLLTSTRGQAGGYRLARDPEEITVAQIISVVDGPIALTECIEDGPGECNIESLCSVRTAWQKINDAIRGALSEITLAELCADQSAMFDIPASSEPAPARPVTEIQ